MKTTTTSNQSVTINDDQRLFVIPCAGGYSCLGFDVCERRTVALARELAALGVNIPAPELIGTLERYAQYAALVEIARQLNQQNGWRSKSELTPELIGLENKRVEVVHQWPSGPEEKARFYVGKSCGWIPCHLEIKRRDSIGGGAVCFGEIKSVRVVGTR